MRTPRVSFPGPLAAGERVELPPGESHHLARVLRRSPGDPVLLHSATGGVFAAAIESLVESPAGLLVRVVVADRVAAPLWAPIPWTVGLALVKAGAFEQALRLAAELGLAGVCPLETARTVVRASRSSQGQEARWRRIAAEAAKQCGRSTPLNVWPRRSLAGFLAEWARARAAGEPCCGLGQGARAFMALPGAPFWPRGHFLEPAGGLLECLFLIGPEGGWEAGEIAQAQGLGFEAIGFPTPVLRVPTAVALTAALGLMLREWEGS